MGWSNDFRSILRNANSLVPKYQLRFLYVGVHGPIAGDIVIDSVKDYNGCKIANTGPKINGCAVIPQRWSVSFGGFSVPVVGDIRKLSKYVPRGAFAELLVDIGSGFERIALGQLKNIKLIHPRYEFIFADLVGSLQLSTDNRYLGAIGTATTARPYQTIFRNIGIEDTLSTDYTAGDTRLYVNNLDLYQKETGEDGRVKVVNASDTFYLTWSAKGANYLTVGTSYVYPSIQAVANAPAASAKVYPVATLEGFPGDIMGKIVTSTGSGANGLYDKYPQEWSAGGTQFTGVLDPNIIDNGDIEDQKYVIALPNQDPNYEWKYILENEFSSGLRDLTTIAANYGQWPIWRQNSLTWRGCIDPYGSSNHNFFRRKYKINDSHIIKVVNHELYNSQVAQVYTASKITQTNQFGGTGQSLTKTFFVNGDPMHSSPTLGIIERGNTYTYSGDIYTSGGRTVRENHASNDISRMIGWDSFTHEKLELECTLSLCNVVAGDIVSMTSKYLYGLCEDINEFYSDKLGMVLSCNYSITRGSCRLTIGILPTEKYRNK